MTGPEPPLFRHAGAGLRFNFRGSGNYVRQTSLIIRSRRHHRHQKRRFAATISSISFGTVAAELRGLTKLQLRMPRELYGPLRDYRDPLRTAARRAPPSSIDVQKRAAVDAPLRAYREPQSAFRS